MRRRPNVIVAHNAMDWAEVVVLGVLTIAFGLVVEMTFLNSSVLSALTIGTPFIAGALAFKRYEWEPVVNRVSAAFVAAFFAMGLQILIALLITT